MDQLAREYHDTHDAEIPEEIFELARRLGELIRQIVSATQKHCNQLSEGSRGL